MIPWKRALFPSKKKLDPNQAAQLLRAHKVKLTWKDLYTDYRNYRRAYFFIPTEKPPFVPRVEVDPAKFSLIQYFKQLFQEKEFTRTRRMYKNVLITAMLTVIYMISQKIRGYYYGWDLGNTRTLARNIASQQPVKDDIYKNGKL